MTQPCKLGGGDVLDSQQAHESDLAAIEAYADRHNVKVYDAKPSNIFTKPDTVQKATRHRALTAVRAGAGAHL